MKRALLLVAVLALLNSRLDGRVLDTVFYEYMETVVVVGNDPVREAIEEAVEQSRSYWARGSDRNAHWVTPTGVAAWVDCESTKPKTGTAGCSMTTANASAAAGDLVYIRGNQGTYSTQLQPANSGTASARITFSGWNGEVFAITGAPALTPGIYLNAVHYITVRGCHSYTNYQLLYIRNGSDYNEVSHCTFNDGTSTANNGINIYNSTTGVESTDGNTHNWLHHISAFDGGAVLTAPTSGNGCEDDGGLLTIGADGILDGVSYNNTVEDSHFYGGSHHAVKLNTRFNVFRRNKVHNEGFWAASVECQTSVIGGGSAGNPDFRGTCTEASIYGPANLYGNRALNIITEHPDGPLRGNTRNLIEDNDIGNTGFPADGNGSDGLTLGGERDIVRGNRIFFAIELGIYFKPSGEVADNNRVYGNTVAHNGFGTSCRLAQGWSGAWPGGVRMPSGADNNVFKNNLMWGNWDAAQSGQTKELVNVGSGNITTPNWRIGNGDPQFVDPTFTNPFSRTQPDLTPRNASVINAGTSLTVTGSAGTSRALVVNDDLYFQYGERGSSLSNIQKDWIAVGTVGNVAQIVSIDRDTKTITLDRDLTWLSGDGVWLKRNSSGRDVLKGAGPDYGAVEQ